MATGPTLQSDRGSRVLVWEWTLAAGETGARIEIGAAVADTVIQAEKSGTTDTFTWEGSIDGTTYYTMSDANGDAISGTADAIYELRSVYRYMRPKMTGSTDTATVSLQATETRQ